MKWLVIIGLLYVLLLADFHATLETSKHIYKFEYNGLIWVALDYYTIIKYHSNDIPMPFLSFKTIDK